MIPSFSSVLQAKVVKDGVIKPPKLKIYEKEMRRFEGEMEKP